MNRTILVLDDEEPIRSALTELLASRGFDVRPAATSAEALQQAQVLEHLDFLITDIELPDLDGVAFSSVVRDLFPEVSVIYISGKSVGYHTRQQVLLPAARILRKPFPFTELMRLLDSSAATMP